MEKILEFLKMVFNKEVNVIRRLRLLRYVACAIIIFIAICEKYWNLLAYIELPCAPLLDEKWREVIRCIGGPMVIAWIIYKTIYGIIYKFVIENLKVSYIDLLIEYVFSLYWLIYVLNIGIEYANGLQIQIGAEVVISVIYLVYCKLENLWFFHQYTYEYNKLSLCEHMSDLTKK